MLKQDLYQYIDITAYDHTQLCTAYAISFRLKYTHTKAIHGPLYPILLKVYTLYYTYLYV